jgi:hypothetical protein
MDAFRKSAGSVIPSSFFSCSRRDATLLRTSSRKNEEREQRHCENHRRFPIPLHSGTPFRYHLDSLGADPGWQDSRRPQNLEPPPSPVRVSDAASGTESQWMSSKGREVLQYRREIPMHDPSKRIALVTGANKGIGFEIARGLGKAGLIVLLGARGSRSTRQTRALRRPT